MKRNISLILTVLICLIAEAQETNIAGDTLRNQAIKVFMEASEYIKREIPYINYVRDISEADLVIVSTSQVTGSGGKEFSYFIEGQNKFNGLNDTLHLVAGPDDTEDIIRIKEVNLIKLGLVRYVIETPLGQHLKVSFTRPVDDVITTDKWRNWVFKASISGFSNGQKSYKSSNLISRISANRITADNKIELSYNHFNISNQYIVDEEPYKSITTTRVAKGLYVSSLNDHWSVGGTIESVSSTYLNYDISVSFSPGIEYNIFPYSQATTQQLRILYTLGPVFNNYSDTTIYNKTKEVLLANSIKTAFMLVKKWGSIELSLMWSNFLRDLSENRLSAYGNVNFRVAKGLNLLFGGNFEFIHDQIALGKSGATPEEILLQKKELATNYSYYINFGISYTFGSMYNNVVNPRFGN